VLVDRAARARRKWCAAGAAILAEVLDGLGSIWPDAIELDGVTWATCGRTPGSRPPARRSRSAGAVHKLSQWLSYSMVEVIEEAACASSGSTS